MENRMNGNAVRVWTKQHENVLRELEICYREMGDYKNAYIYACRQKDAQ